VAVFLIATIAFLLAVVLHSLAWRTLRPASPARALLACGCVAIIIAVAVGRYAFPGMEPAAVLEAVVLAGSLVAAYLISLPGLESESPSFVVVTRIDSKGTAGATEKDLAEVVNDETFVLNRLRSLEIEGLVDRAGDTLRITSRGRRFLRLFTVYHVWAGRTMRAG
jgi:hypothetical protein